MQVAVELGEEEEAGFESEVVAERLQPRQIGKATTTAFLIQMRAPKPLRERKQIEQGKEHAQRPGA